MPWIIDISFDGFGLFVIDYRGAASLTTRYLLFHQGIQEKNIPPRVKQCAFEARRFESSTKSSVYGVITIMIVLNINIFISDMYIYRSFYYHHQIRSIHLSHCYHIFLWLCAWDVCYIIFCHLLHIRSGKTGNLFSLSLCSLWWVQIVGYVLPCRSYSFVCTVHHLIIIILQNYLKTLNL